MADTNRPYDIRHHYYMYDIGWLIDKIQAVSDELEQAIDLRTIHYADPINWDITTQYQANTVVVDNKTGVAYISSKNVPAGVLLTNTEYWNPIFNYNDAINKLMATIAYNEQDSPTATAAHAKGSYIYSNAVLYQAIKDIADGDALKVGANMQLVVLSDAINTAIEAVLAAAREAVNDEATARTEADAALSKRIEAEVAAREDADSNYSGTNRISIVTGDDTRTAGDITDTADNVVIHGKKSVLMDSDGTYTEDITGKKTIIADSVEETYQSTRSIHVAGAQTEAVDSNATKSIDGTYSKTVTGITTETYNAARAITGTNSTESYTGQKVINAQDIRFTPASGALTYSKPNTDGDLVTVPMKAIDGSEYSILCKGTKFASTLAVNVKDYGAVGDGITDDGAAIAAAITAAETNNIDTVYIPDGTYLCNNRAFTINTYKLKLVGENHTKLISKGLTDGAFITLTSPLSLEMYDYAREPLSNICLYGDYFTDTSDLGVAGIAYGTLSEPLPEKTIVSPHMILSNVVVTKFAVGFYAASAYKSSLINCSAIACNIGVYTPAVGTNAAVPLDFYGCFFECCNYAIKCNGTPWNVITFYGGAFEYNRSLCASAGQLVFRGCRIESDILASCDNSLTYRYFVQMSGDATAIFDKCQMLFLPNYEANVKYWIANPYKMTSFVNVVFFGYAASTLFKFGLAFYGCVIGADPGQFPLSGSGYYWASDGRGVIARGNSGNNKSLLDNAFNPVQLKADNNGVVS